MSFGDEEASSLQIKVPFHLVVLVGGEEWQRELAWQPSDSLFVLRTEGIETASAVVTDGSPTVSSAIARIRERARPEAAILVALRDFTPENVSSAHAAGAFACLRRPVLAEELLGLLRSALDSLSAKQRVDDLSLQLDLQEHLASIGRISAGMYHELSNPLFVACANMADVEEACALFAGHPRAEDITSCIADTREALARMTVLLQRFREVGRHEPRSLQAVDLRAVVTDVRRRLADELAAVSVEELVETDTPGQGDAVLLMQIVYNLATNAVHAATSLSAPRVRFHVYVSGNRPVISVRDNGPGIPEDLQQKVFEPFFTTRRNEGGTGLGLALCREYAIRMGARLSLWSVLGRGTCVRLSLPRAG